MNENAISYKLERINNAVDRIRVKTNTTNQPIENVATAVEEVEMIEDYFNVMSSDISITTLSDTEIGGWIHSITKLPKIKCKLPSYKAYFKNLIFEVDLSELDTSIAEDMSRMFSNCNVNSLDLSNWDTSNVKDMSNMFYGSTIASLNISNWNTSNVTNMNYMFSNCNVNSLDLSNWDTSNVTIGAYMFSGSTITSLNLSNWNVSKITDMYYMFKGCSNLENLNLSNWDTSNVTSMGYMFSGCDKLTYLDIRNFVFTNVTYSVSMFNGVPNNCLIIVKDDTAKSWITSKFTNLTNVKTAAEYEGA